MSLQTFSSACMRWLAVLCLLFAFAGTSARAADPKFRGILVWATDADSSPNPHHKPLEPDVVKALKDQLPLKWKNYFAVTNVAFTVPRNKEAEVILSEKCTVQVKDVNGKNLEISLISKDRPHVKRIQPLPKDKLMVFGGNAPGETGWLVVVKRLE